MKVPSGSQLKHTKTIPTNQHDPRHSFSKTPPGFCPEPGPGACPDSAADSKQDQQATQQDQQKSQGKPAASATKESAPPRSIDAGHIRQKFSRGRSKVVIVEKKRVRAGARGATADGAIKVERKSLSARAVPGKAVQKDEPGKTSAPFKDSAATAKAAAPSGGNNLTPEEQAARLQAVEKMREKQEAEQKAAQKLQEKASQEQAAAPPPEPLEAPQDGAQEARSGKPFTKTDREEKQESESSERDKKRKRKEEAPRNLGEKRGEDSRRQRGKLTVSQALNDEERQRSLASLRRKRERDRKQLRGHGESASKIARTVIIPEIITVSELSSRMAERASDVIKLLMSQGVAAKIGDAVDADTAQLVAEEMGHIVKRISESDIEEGILVADDAEESKKPRPPVVAVMGHVDHGKTSLLDHLRHSDTANKEAGGITQHIGAYRLNREGRFLTFLDTPGHEAFSSMRAHGSKVTDVVVLVVAADDGVMPQTIEAINHAKAAQTPLVVAINKMDKAGASPDKIKRDLLQHGVISEDNGGEVLCANVSAKTGDGMDKLVENILLQAELLDLKSNPDRGAQGVVVESHIDRGKGVVATVLVQHGTMKPGDILLAGQSWGRVRALFDESDTKLAQVIPSMPARVLGFNTPPEVGDVFSSVEGEARAREVAQHRERLAREKRVTPVVSSTGDSDIFSKLIAKGPQALNVVVKADTRGSVSTVIQAMQELSNKVELKIIHEGVGAVSRSDVVLAASSKAMVLGFHVGQDARAKEAAEQLGVAVRCYDIIYDFLDAMKVQITGMLDPEYKETDLGKGTVLEIFDVSTAGRVVGSRVDEGVVRRGSFVRVTRKDAPVGEYSIAALRRFKNEVREVPEGQECGLAIKGEHDIVAGDTFVCYEKKLVETSL